MAYLATENVSVTTAADGSATVFTSLAYNGLIHAVVYTPDGTVPFSNNVVVTVTAETSTLAIWSETLSSGSTAATRYPRAATHSTAGVASLYAAAGTAVTDKIPVANERIKIVIASGGNAKVATFRFLVGD